MRISVSLLLVAVTVVMTNGRKPLKEPQKEARQFKQLASLKESLSDLFQLPSAARRPIWDRFNNGIRRQGIAGLLALLGGLGAIGPVAGVVAAVVVTVAVVATVNAVTSQQDESGRGLNSDDWEIHHSVWMEQLRKDFEDSWDTS